MQYILKYAYHILYQKLYIDPFYYIMIKQIFFGKWPPTRRPKPWQDVLHCFEITYKFRDATDPESTNFKTWMRKVLAASTGDAELNFAWQYERSSSKLGRYYYPSIQFQNVQYN